MEWLLNDPLESLNALKLARLEAGQEIFDLSMINPDLAPNRFLIDKLSEFAIKPNNHRYAVSRGVRRLREGFTQKYRQKFGIGLNPDTQVCVTMGTKDALPNLLSCIHSLGFAPKVLVGAPLYPGHLSALNLNRLEFECFKITSNEAEMLTEIEAKLKAGQFGTILLNFPNNPTGLTVSAQFVDSVLKLAERFSLFVVNDFVYAEMRFDQAAANSFLRAGSKARQIEIYSLSKAYSIPGWRVAAALGDEEAIFRLSKLKSHLDYGIFLPIQYAAAAALSAKEDLVKANVAEYNQRVLFFKAVLERLGFVVQNPEAGAFIWAGLPECVPLDALEFAKQLILASGVQVFPGVVFGAEFSRQLRFALVCSQGQLRRVASALSDFMLKFNTALGAAQNLPGI